MNNILHPWLIAALVEYDKERIRRDMKQIGLEEEALQAGYPEEKTTEARLYRPHLLVQIALTVVKSMFS